jgi:hypothetical protein
MRLRLKVIILTILIAGFASAYTSAHSKWFRKGKYHISMVHNGSTHEDKYTNPEVSDIWIEIGQDTIKVVTTEKISQFKFGEGESLDLQAVPVMVYNNVISYIIDHVEVTTNTNGSAYEYMVLRTADGIECNLTNGLVGKSSKGNNIFGMHFTDPDFLPILWCFKYDDIEFYE